MITPIEREVLIEEKELVSLSWLIALSALDSPIAEDAGVTFGGWRSL